METPFMSINLPTHPTRKWQKRNIGQIKYLAFHQGAANASLLSIARYHITPSPDNHISKRGAPGICYTLGVDVDGEIYQMNDLEDITWSNGKVKHYRRPSDADGLRLGKGMNTPTLSVLVNGDFSGPGYKAGDPTDAQIASCMKIARWAHGGPLEIAKNNILGHCHINKKSCPGFILTDMIEGLIWTGEGLIDPIETPVERPEPPEWLGRLVGTPAGMYIPLIMKAMGFDE